MVLDHLNSKNYFFLDVSRPEAEVTLETHPLPAIMTSTHPDNVSLSDKTASISGTSTDSDKTPVRVDSQDSQVSDTETIMDKWPRQNSVSFTVYLLLSIWLLQKGKQIRDKLNPRQHRPGKLWLKSFVVNFIKILLAYASLGSVSAEQHILLFIYYKKDIICIQIY